MINDILSVLGIAEVPDIVAFCVGGAFLLLAFSMCLDFIASFFGRRR